MQYASGYTMHIMKTPNSTVLITFSYTLCKADASLSCAIPPNAPFSPTAEFPEEIVETLQAKGHKVEKTDVLSLVAGTRRTNDLIIGVKDPRSADASALTMSTMP